MYPIYNYINSLIQAILSFHNVTYDFDSDDNEINSQTELGSHLKDSKNMKSIDLESKQIFVAENLETVSNNVETFTRKSKLISPVFKKYLPESPEVTEANGFEQCLQSLISSDDWDFDFMLPKQQELPLSCKSEPAILPTQSDDDKDSSDCSCITDTTVKHTVSDTDLLKRREDASQMNKMFCAGIANRRFDLEWNEKFIETILKEPEQNSDVFMILYVQKKCDNNFVMNELAVRLLKSFIYPHNTVRVHWVSCLAERLFAWMNSDSPVTTLFPTQSLYQPYAAALLLSYSAMFLVRHPDLVFFHNIARVLQILPERLLLLRVIESSFSINQFL